MICEQLIRINNLTRTALLIGSRMDELNVRPNCMFLLDDLERLRKGKELSMMHMLEGGDGFPFGGADHGIEMGAAQERRDLHRLCAWELSLQECLVERQRQSANRIR